MIQWNVVWENFNAREIQTYNIFDNYSFLDDCVKACKKENKDEFADEVKRSLAYWFRWKCEWEFIASGWPPSEKHPVERKIDVYDQITLNWDIFIDWLWEHKKELRKAKREKDKRWESLCD